MDASTCFAGRLAIMSAIAWQRSLDDAHRGAGDGRERLVLMDVFNPG
jgi:hypothetical protein